MDDLRNKIPAINEGKKILKCENCEKGESISHTDSTAKGNHSFRCNKCNLNSSEHDQQKCHIELAHEGEIPHICKVCGKNFKTEEYLNNHVALVHKCTAKTLFEFFYVTAGGVTRIVRNLKNSKAIGVHGISTEILKKGTNVLASPIARICNISLSTGIFPNVFKEAIVYPIFKGSGKNPRGTASYSAISILPSLSKILEIIVPSSINHSY